MENEKLYQLALSFVPGIGSVLIRNLVSYCGSPSEIFKKPKGKLMRVPGIGEKAASNILDPAIMEKAAKELEKLEKENAKIVFYTDKEFPKRLRELNDAPALLYQNGNADLNMAKSVGIVGTRNATQYGKDMVDEIVAGLKRFQDVTVVSGLAYGIDFQAHRSSLKHGVKTIGIMGSGLDRVYPALHQKTAQEMCANQGAILTEYPFGTKPNAPHFPERNRIIAGLSDALIVVEAAEKGGALLTAEIANSYNREIFAVPGRLTDQYSKGCNRLVRSLKANLFLSVDDLEYLLNWQSEDQDEETQVPAHSFAGEQKAIYEALKKGSMHIDELSLKTQVPMGRLASILLEMEFGGWIKSLPGKRYALSVSSSK